MSTLLTQPYVALKQGCGCSLTNASIDHFSVSQMESLENTQLDLARVYAEAAFARTVGVTPSPLDVLLMSSMTQVDKKALQEVKIGTQSIPAPFTTRRRKTNFAVEYFGIESGKASDAAGTTVNGVVYPASSWEITVNTGPSKYRSNPVNIERYFLPGKYLYIESKDTQSAAGSQTQYVTAHKIIASEAVSGGTTGKAKVTIAASYTDAGWGNLTVDEKAVHQPTYGVVQIGANNVADEEVWCYNEAADNVQDLLIDWHQTIRWTHCTDRVYRETLKKILDGEVNEFIRAFRELPETEKVKQSRRHFEKSWKRSIFYGQPINEKQTEATFKQLPQIVDPEDGCLYGYKANALGMRTLLSNENQVIDAKGAALDLDLLFEICYDLKRNREVGGETVDVIDLMTDKDTANMLAKVFRRFLKKEYGVDSITLNIKQGEVLDRATGINFKYNLYDIPSIEVKIAVFVDNYFTDRLTNFGDGSGGVQGSVDLRTRGTAIWAIDWTDFDIGIVANNSRTVENKGKAWQEAMAAYGCIISPNEKTTEMRSTTYTVRMGDAKRSALIENFNNRLCPTATVISCELDGSSS